MNSIANQGHGGAIAIRHVHIGDAPALCAVINPIIEKAGTTAYEEPCDPTYFEAMIAGFGPRDFLHVAEAQGRIVGFQICERHPELPDDTGDIASFVALDMVGTGVGQMLAAKTLAEARARGWRKLFAYIRGDNTGGLAYYDRIGFRTIRTDPGVPLKDGTPVDRVAKRLSL